MSTLGNGCNIYETERTYKPPYVIMPYDSYGDTPARTVHNQFIPNLPNLKATAASLSYRLENDFLFKGSLYSHFNKSIKKFPEAAALFTTHPAVILFAALGAFALALATCSADMFWLMKPSPLHAEQMPVPPHAEHLFCKVPRRMGAPGTEIAEPQYQLN